MADKIKKFLAKLSKRELDSVQALLLDIRNHEIEHLDVKPIKGQKGVYRARKGRIRVIFSNHSGKIHILAIGRRDDQTYRGF
ncbi:MAG: hypothetical protein U5L95_02125 [Candidatus Saccharibacteria bacterium]|nr:hypothetical protein [Candidatus Saccharibacteria bacterium]